MTKGLVLGIIVLFVGIIVIPSNAIFLNDKISTYDEVFSIPMDSRGIIYVDDDNTGGPWDGTLEHPYQYIQDGVDDAVEGDTVYVFNGIYYEHIKIIKSSIKLVGEDKSTTIIDGSGKCNVILIENTSNYNQICNFTIRKGNCGGIQCNSNYNTIYNNIIINNENGISLSYHRNKDGVSSNNIYNNILDNNECWGINLDDGCSNNNIYRNIVSNNGMFGIRLYSSSFNVVYKNQVHNNSRWNIWVNYWYNSIVNNDIRDSKTGIFLIGAFVNTIKKNNFIGNNLNADFDWAFGTRWKGNYWDDWVGFGPKPIYGTISSTYPYGEPTEVVNFDFRPARKPYDIIITNDIEGCDIK